MAIIFVCWSFRLISRDSRDTQADLHRVQGQSWSFNWPYNFGAYLSLFLLSPRFVGSQNGVCDADLRGPLVNWGPHGSLRGLNWLIFSQSVSLRLYLVLSAYSNHHLSVPVSFSLWLVESGIFLQGQCLKTFDSMNLSRL